jgi:hypothetical protein
VGPGEARGGERVGLEGVILGRGGGRAVVGDCGTGEARGGERRESCGLLVVVRAEDRRPYFFST